MDIKELMKLNKIESMKKPTLEEVNAKLNAIIEFQGLEGEWKGDVYEIIKTELPSGDYTNPIKWESGMNVESGKWYFFNDIELPYECIKSGNPKDINNIEYFDFI